MTTKKKHQNTISPELQHFIDAIAAKYQPDPEALSRRIENAKARYISTQQFTDNPARLVDRFQNLILDGWRFRLNTSAAVLSNPAMISVTLHKPDSLIEQELASLRNKVTEDYHTSLFDAMEAEIEQLMNDASDDVKRRAEEQAAVDVSAMKQQLRSLLTQGVV